MAEVKLLGAWASPFSNRILIGLNMKGVEYEIIEEVLKDKSPLLLKSNPVHKKIPVLLHNDKPIAESLVILEYIDETWDGPTIMPKDPYERAMARFWAKFIDEKCWPAIKKALMSSGEEQQKAIEEATELLNFLENEVKGKKFFGGETIGLVDITANIIAYWIPIIGEVVGVELLSEEKFPNLYKWVDDYTNCSYVKEKLPAKDALIEKIKAIFKPAN